MSNRSVGNAFEKKVRGIMEGLGLEVDQARPTLKMLAPGKFVSTPNDFFGCIDLMAFSYSRDRVFMVQTTTGSPYPRRKKITQRRWPMHLFTVMVIERSKEKKQEWIVHFLREAADLSQGWEKKTYDSKSEEHMKDLFGMYQP